MKNKFIAVLLVAMSALALTSCIKVIKDPNVDKVSISFGSGESSKRELITAETFDSKVSEYEYKLKMEKIDIESLDNTHDGLKSLWTYNEGMGSIGFYEFETEEECRENLEAWKEEYEFEDSQTSFYADLGDFCRYQWHHSKDSNYYYICKVGNTFVFIEAMTKDGIDNLGSITKDSLGYY